MKPITLALLATAAALAVNSARADTRVSIGFNVGGPACRPETPVVVYTPPPTVVYAPAPTVVYAPAPVHGYWKEIVVKTWVPERWLSSHDRWGRPVRVCEPGYFAFRTDRVWVDRHSDYGYRHDGHDNRVGYDYSNYYNRGGWNR
ncbi:MAG: hypothetical protein EXS37_04400 [Opitutus sp.]|nr:hypothetical protein [Opitutus sp.]